MDSTGTEQQCKATAKSGERCQGAALPEDSFCWWHSPDKAEERADARSKGGYARHGRKIGETSDGEKVLIRSAADVIPILERAVNDLLCLENSISRARTLGYLAGVVVKAYEVTDLSERLAALEEALRSRDEE